jgi:hypothetical protein
MRAAMQDFRMKPLWCSRCKAEMLMLDEEEFAQIAGL